MQDGIDFYHLCLFYVLFHLAAVPGLIWAIKRRQFARDAEAHETLAEEDSGIAPAASKVSRRGAVVMIMAFSLIVAFFLYSTVAVIIESSVSAPSAHMGAAKCPI